MCSFETSIESLAAKQVGRVFIPIFINQINRHENFITIPFISSIYKSHNAPRGDTGSSSLSCIVGKRKRLQKRSEKRPTHVAESFRKAQQQRLRSRFKIRNQGNFCNRLDEIYILKIGCLKALVRLLSLRALSFCWLMLNGPAVGRTQIYIN